MSADDPLMPLPTGSELANAISAPVERRFLAEVARHPLRRCHRVVRPTSRGRLDALGEGELQRVELRGVFGDPDYAILVGRGDKQETVFYGTDKSMSSGVVGMLACNLDPAGHESGDHLPVATIRCPGRQHGAQGIDRRGHGGRSGAVRGGQHTRGRRDCPCLAEPSGRSFWLNASTCCAWATKISAIMANGVPILCWRQRLCVWACRLPAATTDRCDRLAT